MCHKNISLYKYHHTTHPSDLNLVIEFKFKLLCVNIPPKSHMNGGLSRDLSIHFIALNSSNLLNLFLGSFFYCKLNRLLPNMSFANA